MFNKVILAGNLSKDIELRHLPSGSAIANTSIATNRKFKKQNGSQGEEVCFIDLTFFGRSAEVVNQYCRKGSKVLVEGRLKLDTWQDQNGNKRSKHSIQVESMQMLDSKSNNQPNQGGYNQNQPQQQNNSQTNYGGNQAQQFTDIDESEDIPF